MAWKGTKLQRNEVLSTNSHTKENKKEQICGLQVGLYINRGKAKHNIKAINWIIEVNPNKFESIK